MDVLPFEKGPWTKLVESKFSGFEVSIFQNPEKWALTSIFIKENNQVTHLVTQVYAPFTATGNASEFAKKIKGDSFTLNRVVAGREYQYFVIASGTSYFGNDPEQFKSSVNDQIRNTVEKVEYTQKVSRAYGVVLTPMASSEREAEAAFFGEPIMGPILTTRPMESRISERIGKVTLGVDFDDNKFELPGLLFKRCLVHGGEEHDRNHAAHVLAEGFLLSGIPVLVFDWEGSMSSLSLPSESLDKLKQYKIELEPSGFPVKSLSVPEEAHVEIATVPVESWREMLGFGPSDAGKYIIDTMQESRERISRISEAQEFLKPKIREDNGFSVRRASRILELARRKYDKYFNGTVDSEQLLNPWTEFLGRAAVANFKGVNEEIGRSIVHSVLKAALSKMRESGQSTKLRGVVIIPKADFVCPQVTDSLAGETIKFLQEFVNYGGGYVLIAGNKADVSSTIVESLDSEVNIIQDNNAAVRQRDGKISRIKIRPALSKCGEGEGFTEVQKKA